MTDFKNAMKVYGPKLKNVLTYKWRGNPHDQWVDFKYWFLIWKASFEMMQTFEGRKLTSEEKKTLSEAMFKYPWMFDAMKYNNMVNKASVGRHGATLEAFKLIILYSTKSAIPAIQRMVLCPETTVFAHSMLPNELFQAMDIKVARTEQAANSLCLADQHAEEPYLDAMYNMGLQENTCTYSTQTPGMVLSGAYPDKCLCLISSSMPCEAHFQGYTLMAEKFNAPTYWLELPYNTKDEKNIAAFVADIKGMIQFLEEQTGHKIDWDKLREACERHNRNVELERERWELNATSCPPISDDALWLSHMQIFQLETTTSADVELGEKLNALYQKAYERRESVAPCIRYRVVLWSTPPFSYIYIWNWLERCWGVQIVNDMESYGSFSLIDTSTNDSMLEGIGLTWRQGTMIRHIRGPVENWIGDLNALNEMYKPEFVLNLNHNNCRGHLGMTGYITEWSRQKKVPVCNVNYNFYDMRICSRQGIRDQINSFMSNVMHAEPLDPSLLVFDDSNDW